MTLLVNHPRSSAFSTTDGNIDMTRPRGRGQEAAATDLPHPSRMLAATRYWFRPWRSSSWPGGTAAASPPLSLSLPLPLPLSDESSRSGGRSCVSDEAAAPGGSSLGGDVVGPEGSGNSAALSDLPEGSAVEFAWVSDPPEGPAVEFAWSSDPPEGPVVESDTTEPATFAGGEVTVDGACSGSTGTAVPAGSTGRGRSTSGPVNPTTCTNAKRTAHPLSTPSPNLSGLGAGEWPGRVRAASPPDWDDDGAGAERVRCAPDDLAASVVEICSRRIKSSTVRTETA